jgi:pyruvate/2-oxoglutarate dehydrogenase complex dihydrolipoamide dehydrogenase (E3) component
MTETPYDIITIGAGSGGLSVGLAMNKLGFNVLMIAKSDKYIGGDCLNDGCVPSKALIHVSRIVHNAKQAMEFGLNITGKADIQKAIAYVYQRQEIIRNHENSKWLNEQGIDVALGEAKFAGKNKVEVNRNIYTGKNIVIATGSKPRKLNVPGIENVQYFDNDNIFYADSLPEKILVIGGGPIGIEIAQALRRFGKEVTVVHHGSMILEHDDERVTSVLLKQLEQEGIRFLFNAEVEKFNSATEALIKLKDGKKEHLLFDAIFVGIGRELQLESLQLQNAGIDVKNHKIVLNEYLQTTNKHVFACGDVAGDLVFSHAAEFHARILINNFLSPLKKKLNNDYLSWVTFTDPEIATFGLNEKQLKDRHIKYERLEQDFKEDDRAVIDNYQYGKIILYISTGNIFKKEKILGGTMVAPHAGELIQELILANTERLSVNTIFNKIYPYPVASRINQNIISKRKEKRLTDNLKKLLKVAYKLFG